MQSLIFLLILRLMDSRTDDFQTIDQDNTPEFVVIPYKKFIELFPKHLHEIVVPHPIASLMANKKISRIRAWREHLKLTQKEVAKRLKISQAALSQMEIPGKKLQKTTVMKLAKALGLPPEQLH